MTRLRSCILAFACLAAWAAPSPAQSTFDQIGMTALIARTGPARPTGIGVPVMQGEAIVGENPYLYLADNSTAEIGGRVIDRSGGGGVSGHAQAVAVNGFGLASGVAPGVPAIHGFRVVGNLDSGDWLGPIYLNFGGGAPVDMSGLRVQNHSWIATGSFDPDIQEIHRRFDFALRRDNVVACVGVNNGGGTPIPPLLGNSYNAIAVGLTNADSSFGPSTGDVVGRSKPDIVAPSGATSFATPLVAGASAILIQSATQMGAQAANAGRMETIKSVLLSGATKDEFGGAWTCTNNGTYVEPLDRRWGAGELNVDFSHRILIQGQQNGTDLLLDSPLGWDFTTMTGVGAVRRYFFDVPSNLSSVPFSATATWLRRITPTGEGANLFASSTATLSDVELRLFNSDGSFNLGSMIDSSVSPIDNVQHMYQATLLGGHRYAIEVLLAGLPSGQGSEDVAVSWFTTVPVPEPGSIALVAIGGAGMLAVARRQLSRRKRRRTAESAATL